MLCMIGWFDVENMCPLPFQVAQSQDGRETQYPCSNITSATQKDTIRNSLVPLLNRSGAAMAFRILWRRDEAGREIIWKRILDQRQECDNFVKRLPGIAYFFSSITGMLVRISKPTVVRYVYPAVAYWVVLKSVNVNPRDIVRAVQTGVDGQAEVKLLQEPPLLTTVDPMSSTLCTVMKDHGNGYVKRRMHESHLAQGDTSDTGQPVRIVALPSDLIDVAKESRDILLQRGAIDVDYMELF